MSLRYFLFCLLLITLSQVVSSQSGKFESFDGTQIAYTDEGSGDVVLLLHGFINSRKSWDKTALKKGLLNAGYRVIIPDLRGNGDSDKPQIEEAYQDNAEVKDVLLLMNHLNIEKYKAVGYSRGSIVLAKLLTKDDSIEKAVLGGMGIDFTNADWDRRIMFAKAFDGDINEMTKGAVDYARSINADLRSLHLQQKFQPVTTISELNKIEIDVMVICGDEDNDNGNAEELSKAFKNGSLKRVPGDHNGTYKTVGFSLAVLQFLD
ncbi:alpha/beta fold hydrolase [Maribacter sp. BPC-D8]|uniref:alpha/beta fold hydrolase n=1 Tax=Maribacter sp. BPC-D8 TaxID=3053613 RepID=UPI002B4A9A53|nr:alpha/beta fold hydrolase [Maribacter sp. BPC-D8]WRI30375.1 alpha/beta fold hydrolase [Maribacter sp. BPC-D8]